MPETEDIVQRIVLTGNDEVVEALHSIQEAWTQAFEAARRAAETHSFGGFVAGVLGLTAAVSGVTVAMFEWSKSASETINEMSELGAQAGTTIDDITSLVSVLTRTGGNADEMASSFRRAAVIINTSWVEIKKAARDSADSLRADMLAVETASIALSRAQETQRLQSRTAADLEINNANSIRDAQLNLREAYVQLDAARGRSNPREQRNIAEQRAILAVSQARQRLDDQERKAAQDRIDAENKAQEAAIAAETAQLNLSAARKKAAEDASNDIVNVTAAVNKLASGHSEALKGINASAENIVRGVISSVGQSSNALKGMKGALEDLNSPAPQVKEVLLKLADVFHNTDDAALKTAVAVRFFGHAISQDTIDALSEGSAAMLEHQKHLNDLGLTYTKTEDDVNRRFRTSMSELIEDVKITGNKFAIAFAPLFTDVLNQLTGGLEQNLNRIQSWAHVIVDTVRPAISGLIASFTGFHLDTLSPKDFVKAEEWRETFTSIEGYAIAFKDKIRDFFLNTIPVSVGVATKALELVATVFEKLTGIHLSPEQMGVTLMVGQITGLNGVIFHLGELILGLGLIFATASIPLAAFGVTANVSLGGIIIILGLVAGAVYLVYLGLEKLSNSDFAANLVVRFERIKDRVMALGEALKNLKDFATFKISFDEMLQRDEAIDKRIEAAHPFKDSSKDKEKEDKEKLTKDDGSPTGIFAEIKKLLTGPSEDAKRNLEDAKHAVAEGAAQGAGALTGSAVSLKGAADALTSAASGLGRAAQGASGSTGTPQTSGGIGPGTGDQATPTYNGPPRGGAMGGPVADLIRFALGGPVSDGGGPVRGPGTGTSDSIPAIIDGKRPARIANGEFIVRADGSNLMDAFHFFAKGFNPMGFADMFGASTPAFASGGPVGDSGGGGLRGYYAVDLRTDKGTYRVRADEATARSLNKDASLQRMVSTGKNPSWY